MSKLRLTLACGDYDFLRPLINGEIQPQGIELNVLTMPSPERHGRMLRHEEFDVCELSLVGYLVARDQGCNYNAIPVFPAPPVSSPIYGQKNWLRHRKAVRSKR